MKGREPSQDAIAGVQARCVGAASGSKQRRVNAGCRVWDTVQRNLEQKDGGRMGAVEKSGL